MDGVINDRTISVSNSRPSAIVVPIWPSTRRSLKMNDAIVNANTRPAAVTTEPLPAIAIPLRKSDSDVVLDLQSLIALSYRNGRYDEIDYRKEPKPKLDREDAAWADELLKGKGMR